MSDKKLPTMTYAEFASSYRYSPQIFWAIHAKSCSCDESDVRYEKTGIECGACGRKLKLR